MMLALAVEWAPQVRCNVVAPGSLPFPEAWADKDRELAVRASIPLGRLGDFSDLANAVRWLTLEATYVTGEVIKVDGGRSLSLR
jgi:pteridine reductase